MLLFSLIATAVLAAADVPVSTPVYINAPGHQAPAAVASDGKQFLVVWLDERPAAGLYASRVGGSGVVFDRTGIRIASRASAATAFWNGTRFVVMWFDGGSIIAQLVEANGTIVDAPRVIVTSVNAGSHFAAFNGSRFTVVYIRGTQIESAQLDRDARPVNADVVIPGSATAPPSIANS